MLPAAVLLIAACVTRFAFGSAAAGLIDVFTSGSEGYACYRIPAMVSTANGTLLVFAEARYYSCADHGYVDLVVKTSDDGGSSWGPLQLVHSESSRHGPNVTIGNAAPVVLATGRILLPFCRNNSEVGVLYSDDGGRGWAQLASIAVPAAWTWVATGPPGSLELTPGGRVVVPANHVDAASGAASHAFTSDDGGRTWATSADIPGGNEDQAVALSWVSPQAVLLNMRPASGSRRLVAQSTDGGSTWGVPWHTLTETACEASTAALPRHPGGPLLVQSSAFDTSARANMTLHTSTDNGHTWSAALQVRPGKREGGGSEEAAAASSRTVRCAAPSAQVYAGAAAYSTLVAISDSAVALAFERDSYKFISFVSPLSPVAP